MPVITKEFVFVVIHEQTSIFGYDLIWITGPGTKLDFFVAVDGWILHKSDINDKETDFGTIVKGVMLQQFEYCETLTVY